MRRLIIALIFVLTLGVAWFLWRTSERDRGGEGAATANAASPAGTDARASASRKESSFSEAEFPIIAQFNRADGSIQRDLEVLNEVFEAWRTNFPREGNPVGENSDITATLAGRNPLGFALVPKNHPAINEAGELCDRWGTPFRFHQLSGEQMEIRSAGPDRTFATADDVLWTPP